MNGLPREVANAVGAQDVNGLGGFFDGILKGAVRAIANIKEIVAAHTAEEGENLVGIPNNWDEIIVSEIINDVIMLAALLASALGFAICALDRKSVVQGTSGSVRVTLGGGRLINKKKYKNK